MEFVFFFFFEFQLFQNGTDDDHQSLSNATVEYTHVASILARGKSLSPPKIIACRKQVITSSTLFNRTLLAQRHLARPLNILRRQRLISKAKQQAKLSPSSPSKMGKSIAVDNSQKIAKVISTSDKEAKANSSDESEYSSLEDDDDDVTESHDSDDNDFSDSEDKIRVDNRAVYNSFDGSYTSDSEHPMLADSVSGKFLSFIP